MVQARPVAILRFSLKYVFNARAFADALIPEPIPIIQFQMNRKLNNVISYFNLPYKIEKVIKYVMNELDIDINNIDAAMTTAPIKPT